MFKLCLMLLLTAGLSCCSDHSRPSRGEALAEFLKAFTPNEPRFDVHFTATIINGFPHSEANIYSYDFRVGEDRIEKSVKTGRAEWQETCYFRLSENGWQLVNCDTIAGSTTFSPA